MCVPKGTLCCSSPAALSGTLRFFLQLRQLRSIAGLHAGELPARLRARAEPLSTHPGPGCCCCWESRNQGGGDPSLLFARVHPAGNPNSSFSIASGWFAADKLRSALNTGGREINALKKSPNKSPDIALQTQASQPGSPGFQGAPPATLPPFQPLPAGCASSRETSSAPEQKMSFLLGCLNECKGAGQPHSSQAMAGAGGFRLGAAACGGSCVSPTRKDIRTSPAPWGLGDCASSASGDGKRAIFHPRNRNWGSYSQHRH